jgi:C4-dicarboxylate-specific signal transduction histidine kinase
MTSWRCSWTWPRAALSVPDGRRGEVVIRLFPGTRATVRIEVSDDGPGIAPELLERIFEPSFTTRTQGRGTGLVELPVASEAVNADPVEA